MELTILTILLISNIALVIYLFFRKNNDKSSDLILQISNNLTGQVQDIRKEINENSEKSRFEIESKLKLINKEISDFQVSSKTQMQKQFTDSNKIIKDVTTELEKIKGTNEKVLSFANQMKTLEKILGNPKQRGIFGEVQLENLLSHVLPREIFQMQYSFKNGDIVDAIVKINDLIIPIDAKFPLDNYNKMIETENPEELKDLEKVFKNDIKKRILETSKYIRPQENTVEYSYMFIPADGLYQDLLNNKVGSLNIKSKELVNFAYDNKVMIVSPMSLFPMLQICMKALNNLKFEKSIARVIKNVSNLSSHLKTYQLYHDKLGNTLGTLVNHYNRSSDEFKKIDKDVLKISDGDFAVDFDKKLIEKPKVSDES